MNPAGIPLKEPSVSAAAGDTEQLERALIDASTRVPVLIFYTSAMAWLILGTLLAGFVSFKLHTPDLLSVIAIGATLGFVYLRIVPRTSLFPVRDPRLIESLNLVN